jgi:hypothetical protein
MTFLKITPTQISEWYLLNQGPTLLAPSQELEDLAHDLNRDMGL